ncbi:hypothetical protein OMAG_002456 [Candidatus Omnitrophus magneticus]|uniref:Uncharacterized protein n=1 Tax=Candidatus Omnitrophus magneticus TaxID=1609969 RepID=A0A0F0CQ97_9BACT|nr:hypothetical protein OMAG_002456 [Candidatus Omnitrophus magneticus]
MLFFLCNHFLIFFLRFHSLPRSPATAGLRLIHRFDLLFLLKISDLYLLCADCIILLYLLL